MREMISEPHMKMCRVQQRVGKWSEWCWRYQNIWNSLPIT